MKKIKIAYLISVALFLNTYAIASEESFEMGIVQQISESRIELEMQHTGSYSHIGFFCEPEICMTTQKIKIGDKVLLTLAAIDRRNKLLSIRKCTINDVQCDKVREISIKEHVKRKQASELAFKKIRQCRDRMDQDLMNDNRYVFKKEHEYSDEKASQIREKYKSMYAKPNYKQCLYGFVKTHEKALLETCLKHDCGQGIGGGCYHIAGNAISINVLEAAMVKCEI